MLIEQHSPPEILVHGLVTPEDVDKLFEMQVTLIFFIPYVNRMLTARTDTIHVLMSVSGATGFRFPNLVL